MLWMRLTNFAGMGAKLLARWNGAPSAGGLSRGAVWVEASGAVGSRLRSNGVEREGGSLGEGGRRTTAVMPWRGPGVGRGKS